MLHVRARAVLNMHPSLRILLTLSAPSFHSTATEDDLDDLDFVTFLHTYCNKHFELLLVHQFGSLFERAFNRGSAVFISLAGDPAGGRAGSPARLMKTADPRLKALSNKLPNW